MKITKIKQTGKDVVIEYEDSTKEIDKTTKFVSKNIPHPDFIIALEVLGVDVIKILELPKEYIVDLKVKSISIAHEEMGKGCVISAQKKLQGSDAPFCLNTPYQPPCRHSNQEKFITSELSDKINILISEAVEYMKGKQAQLEFDLKSKIKS